METRNIKITLDKAKEWYNSGDTTLKEVALQAFNEDELVFNFKNITSFKKACNALNLNYDDIPRYVKEGVREAATIAKDVARYSRASAAMFKLNIIRKALNLGQDLHLTKDPKDSQIYYPFCPFTTKTATYYKNSIVSGEMEIIGKIKSEGEEYNVFGGDSNYGGGTGLGYFDSSTGVGFANANFGLLGCATKEIANHFSKYFGMLIIEAKYGDLLDFKVVERKYN